jgi:hypothetical protein
MAPVSILLPDTQRAPIQKPSLSPSFDGTGDGFPGPGIEEEVIAFCTLACLDKEGLSQIFVAPSCRGTGGGGKRARH